MPFIKKGLPPPPIGGFLKPHAPHRHFGQRPQGSEGVVLPENPNTIIRIKRSSSAVEAPKLYAGELAYSWAEGVNKLWIGVGEGEDGFAEQAVCLADGEGSAVVDALNRFFVFDADGNVMGITCDGGDHVVPAVLEVVDGKTSFTFGGDKTVVRNLHIETKNGDIPLFDYLTDIVGDHLLEDAIKAKLDEITLEDLGADALVKSAVEPVAKRVEALEDTAELTAEQIDALASAIDAEKAERSLVDGKIADDFNAKIEDLKKALADEKAERSLVDGQVAKASEDKDIAQDAEIDALKKAVEAEEKARAFNDGKVADMVTAAKEEHKADLKEVHDELLEDIDERYADAKAYTDAREGVIRELIGVVDGKIGSLADIEGKFAKVEEKVNHFDADLKQTEDDLKGLMNAGDEALQVQIDALKGKAEIAEAKDASLQAQINALDTKMDAEEKARADKDTELAVAIEALSNKVADINSAPELVAGHGIELDTSVEGKVKINAVDQVLPIVASADDRVTVKKVDNAYTVALNVDIEKTVIESADGSVGIVPTAKGFDLSVDIPEIPEAKKIVSDTLMVFEDEKRISIDTANIVAKDAVDNNLQVRKIEKDGIVKAIELYAPRQAMPSVKSSDGSVSITKVDGDFDISVDVPTIEPVVASEKEGNIAEVVHTGGEYKVFVPASEKRSKLLSEVDFINVYKNEEGDYVLRANAGDRSDDFADLTAKTLVSSNHSIIIRQNEERKTVDLMMPKIRSKDGSVKIEADPDNLELNLSVELGGVSADEIADKVADKIENKVADKVKKEVKDELIDDLGDKVKDEILDDVVAEVKDSLGDEFADEVAEKVQDAIEFPVKDIKAKGSNVTVTKSNGVYSIAVAEPDVPSADEIAEQVIAQVEEQIPSVEEVAAEVKASLGDEFTEEVAEKVKDSLGEDFAEEIAEKVAEKVDIPTDEEIQSIAQSVVDETIASKSFGLEDADGQSATVAFGESIKFVAEGDATVSVSDDKTVTIGVEVPDVDETIGVTDYVATTVGALTAGTKIEDTMTIKEILKKILFKAVDISGLSMTLYDDTGATIGTGYERFSKVVKLAKISLAWVPGNQGEVAQSNVSMTQGVADYTVGDVTNGTYKATTTKSSKVDIIVEPALEFSTDMSFASKVKSLTASKDVKFYLPVFYKAVAEVPSAETDVKAWSKATLGADKADQTLKVVVSGEKYVSFAYPKAWGAVTQIFDTDANAAISTEALAKWNKVEVEVQLGDEVVPYVVYSDSMPNVDTTVNYKVKFK